jgi:hypothetical protein
MKDFIAARRTIPKQQGSKLVTKVGDRNDTGVLK